MVAFPVFSRCWAFITSLACFVALHGGLSSIRAEDSLPPGKVTALHPHNPIDIESPPVVTRVKATLMRPRRLLVDSLGTLTVCDWGAGTVLEISTDGKSTVLAAGLNEPSAVARDAAGHLYVTTHAQGTSKGGGVIRVTRQGEQMVFADGLTGPTDLVFDSAGNLYVACFHENSVIRISPSGQTTTFVSNIPAPAAIAFGKGGMLYVAGSLDGVVYKVTPQGEFSIHARGLQTPSDLFFDSEGRLVVANYSGTELSRIDEKGTVRQYAVVPKGTIGGAFDADDNLVLLNWDLHFATKVVTRLSLPCPHCGRGIPVRLKSTAKPAAVKPPRDKRMPRKVPVL